MRKALIFILCISMLLFAGCTPVDTEATETPAATTADVSPSPEATPAPSAEPSPTDIPTPTPTPSPTVAPTISPTPHPTQDLSAILGKWYSVSDAYMSIEFHADGTADFKGMSAECTGYEFDPHTKTGTVYLDDGGGPFPYDISITGSKLNMLGDVYIRTPHPNTAIVGTWYCTTDASLYIIFYSNGTADFHGSPAECTGYEFDPDTKTGSIFLDDGGGPFPYDISITGGKLNLLGDVYTR